MSRRRPVPDPSVIIAQEAAALARREHSQEDDEAIDRQGRAGRAIARALDKLNAELSAWRDLAEARNDLLACYRVGRMPSQKVLQRMDAARKKLQDLGEAEGGM